MNSALDLAIDSFEKQKGEKVFSIRPIEGNHFNVSFLVNMSTLVQIGRKDALALPMNEKNPEWAFYTKRAQGDYPGPYPHFLSVNQMRSRIEPFIFGSNPFQRPEIKESEALRIVDAIADFHRLPYEVPVYPLLERFRYFQSRGGSPLPATFENKILTKVDHLLGQGHFALCHHQLRSNHIVLSDEGPIFLDFEMVGMDCPLLDLASLVEENELDSPLARKCLTRFNLLHTEATYSYEDLEALVVFLDAYWYYRHSSYHAVTKEEHYADWAKKKKERFLFAFNSSLMGDE